MEYNGKMYFGWPLPAWTGKVYEVDPEAVGLGSIVQLPDETELQLVVNGEGFLRVSKASSRNRGGAQIFEAIEVFDTNAEPPLFEGNWEHMLWQLNAAAAVNALFVVYLPQEEYERLAARDCSEFEALKERMSPRAAFLVALLESNYCDDDDGLPVLFLYRTGCCP